MKERIQEKECDTFVEVKETAILEIQEIEQAYLKLKMVNKGKNISNASANSNSSTTSNSKATSNTSSSLNLKSKEVHKKLPSNYVCRICNKPGHSIFKCPNKAENSNKSESKITLIKNSETKIFEINLPKDIMEENQVMIIPKLATIPESIEVTSNGIKTLALLDLGADVSAISLKSRCHRTIS